MDYVDGHVLFHTGSGSQIVCLCFRKVSVPFMRHKGRGRIGSDVARYVGAAVMSYAKVTNRAASVECFWCALQMPFRMGLLSFERD